MLASEYRLVVQSCTFAVSSANTGRASYFWKVTNYTHIIQQRRPKHISISHVKVITCLPDINIISLSILSFHTMFILGDHHGNASQPHAQLQRGPVPDQLLWTEFNLNRQPKSAAGNQTKLIKQSRDNHLTFASVWMYQPSTLFIVYSVFNRENPKVFSVCSLSNEDLTL